MDFYLFLDSKATKEYKIYVLDFTVDLPANIDFNRQIWEIGLMDIPVNSEGGLPAMILCTNIISPSLVSKGWDQILRFIPTINSSDNYLEFSNILYHDIVANNLDRMRVYIKPFEMLTQSLESDRLYCTLHLRRKESI